MKISITNLIKKQSLSENIFSFTMDCEEIARTISPGQFINVLVEDLPLRRPFFLFLVEKNSIRIIFKVKGKGTTEMSKWQEGKKINIIGPLGHGFSAVSPQDRILLIGGGVGLAPLLELAKTAKYVHTLAGFTTKKEIILKNEFQRCGNLTICTNDGSFEKKGFVTDFILPIILNNKINKIAACGPEKMLDAIAKIAKEEKIFCEISIEERMGCGIGACLCCHKIIEQDEIKKSVHVCKDGPVFVI